VRWEFSRPIVVTPVIRLITIERFIKAVVLIAGGIVLLVVSSRGDSLRHLAQQLQSQLNLDAGRGVFHHFLEKVLSTFATYSRAKEEALAVGAMLYGLLEGFEGAGLLLRRRWAEYLVLVATAAFLPLEINELRHGITLFRLGALIVNVLIIAYLVWRKRLFLERPGHATADRAST
jgi:uncharacterized membrane protein (DUF2068 family)